MITVRKALALLLCLVMCLGLAPAVYAEGGLEAEAVFNSAEAYIATVNDVGCRTLKEINEAISGGGTLILVDNVGSGKDDELFITGTTSLKLNGKALNVTLRIGAELSIYDADGSGRVLQEIPAPQGGSLKLYGGHYTSSAISKYVAADYMPKKIEDKDWQVVKRDNVAESAIAVVNGTEFYTVGAVNAFLADNKATVKLHLPFDASKLERGGISFQKGGVLDLAGQTLTGDVINRGASLTIQDSGSTGVITGKVSSPTGDPITITGGRYDQVQWVSRWIAAGYELNEEGRVLPIKKVNQAMIGSAYYKTLNDAVEAAIKGDRIIALERTDLHEDYTIDEKRIEKNITLQLGSNGVEDLTVAGATVGILDGFFGAFTAENNATVTVSGTRFGAMPNVDETSDLNSDVALDAQGTDKHMAGTPGTISFLCGQTLEEAKPIFVDSTALAKAAYTIDGKVISLKADYLNKLDVGAHTLRLLTGRDEYAEAEFEILASSGVVTIEGSPYTKGSSSKGISASPVDPELYSAFAYSTENDGTKLTEIGSENYFFEEGTKKLWLKAAWLDSINRGTYYLYGFHSEAAYYVPFDDFIVQNQKPAVTKSPVSQSVADGDSVTFAITASGEDLSYQWYRRLGDTVTGTEVPGATAARYIFTAHVEDNGYQYWCEVSNEDGDATSDIAQLSVVPAVPEITRQPGSRTVLAKTNTSFTVEAKGGNLDFVWYCRPAGESVWTKIDSEIEPSAVTSTLTVTASINNNGTEYRCQVSNPKGTVNSNAARLTVLRPEKLETPELLSVEESLDGGAVFEWKAVDYAQMYRVFRKTEEDRSWLMLADVTATSYTDTSVKERTEYSYTVRCVKTDGSDDSDRDETGLSVEIKGSCTVSFDVSGGTKVEAQKILKGSKATEPAVPKKGGVWFIRWYEDKALTREFDFETQITKDTTLYARWEKPAIVTPLNLTEIGEEAFAGDAAFAAVQLQRNVKKIGSKAFANCGKLCAIYIPEGTTEIAGNAFDDGTGLIILGKAGSYAETFAKGHGFDFRAVS